MVLLYFKPLFLPSISSSSFHIPNLSINVLLIQFNVLLPWKFDNLNQAQCDEEYLLFP